MKVSYNNFWFRLVIKVIVVTFSLVLLRFYGNSMLWVLIGIIGIGYVISLSVAELVVMYKINGLKRKEGNG